MTRPTLRSLSAPAHGPENLLGWRYANRRLRIVIHDFAGHPFQIQLSRELARRGHEVHHLYFRDDWTPRGRLAPAADDPPTLKINGIGIKGSFEKYNYIKRVLQEREYAGYVADYINEIRPDIVSLTAPVDTLSIVRKRCISARTFFILYMQDIFSLGVRELLKRKLGPVGSIVGRYYTSLEQANLRRADKIICITEDFRTTLRSWSIPADRMEVIENWAPLDELAPYSGPRLWVEEYGLKGKRIVLYSGTLGLKHNPKLLSAAARHLAVTPGLEDAVMLVITEGLGAELLEQEKAQGGLDNLVILPWQPYERLAEILSSAELVLAMIERDAGTFCVPSKVLSYLSVGCPILLSSPQENLAVRTVRRAHAGEVVEPEDEHGFIHAVQRMLSDREALAGYAASARRYAETVFDIRDIADRFEALWAPKASVAYLRAAE